MTTDLPPDETLVARARSDDMDAFDALVRRHQSRVFNLALRKLPAGSIY